MSSSETPKLSIIERHILLHVFGMLRGRHELVQMEDPYAVVVILLVRVCMRELEIAAPPEVFLAVERLLELDLLGDHGVGSFGMRDSRGMVDLSRRGYVVAARLLGEGPRISAREGIVIDVGSAFRNGLLVGASWKSGELERNEKLRGDQLVVPILLLLAHYPRWNVDRLVATLGEFVLLGRLKKLSGNRSEPYKRATVRKTLSKIATLVDGIEIEPDRTEVWWHRREQAVTLVEGGEPLHDAINHLEHTWGLKGIAPQAPATVG